MFKFLKNIFYRESALENPRTPLNSLGYPSTLSTIHVDESSAMGFIPIYAAINRISTDVASLSLKVYENVNGGKHTAPDNPIYDLIHHSPDGIITSFRWRQAMMGHVLTYGNGYSKIIRNGAGTPIRLQLLPPNQVTPEVLNGQLVYKWQGKEGLEKIPFFNMLHVAGLGFDGLKGYSPIKVCMSGISSGMAAEAFGNAFFGNAARPSGVLTSTKELTEQARKNLREGWQAVQGGPTNAGRTALLEDGVTWSSISIPPEEGQWIQTMNFSVTNIARLYGLPPHKIGDYSRATFSNIEESNQDYLETSLRPWCDSIEGELNIKLFSKDERKRYFCQHNFMSFLRANSDMRSKYYAMARQWGWMNVDEIRSEEGQNRLANGEGQIYLSPLNMIDSDKLGKAPLPLSPTTPKPINEAKHPDDEEDDDEEERQAVHDVVLDGVNRLLRREFTAIRRNCSKTDFKKWIDEFYDEHVSNIIEQLTPSVRCHQVVTKQKTNLKQLAHGWCQMSMEALKQLEEVTTSDQRPEAIETLLTGWERDRAEKIFKSTK